MIISTPVEICLNQIKALMDILVLGYCGITEGAVESPATYSAY